MIQESSYRGGIVKIGKFATILASALVMASVVGVSSRGPTTRRRFPHPGPASALTT